MPEFILLLRRKEGCEQVEKFKCQRLAMLGYSSSKSWHYFYTSKYNTSEYYPFDDLNWGSGGKSLSWPSLSKVDTYH